jgi:hypothetical protein
MRHDDGTWLALGATAAAGVIGAALGAGIGSRAERIPTQAFPRFHDPNLVGPVQLDPDRAMLRVDTWIPNQDMIRQDAIEVIENHTGLAWSETATYATLPHPGAPYANWGARYEGAHHTMDPTWLQAYDLERADRKEAIDQREAEAITWGLDEALRQLDLPCLARQSDVSSALAACRISSRAKLDKILDTLNAAHTEVSEGELFWYVTPYVTAGVHLYPNGPGAPGVDLGLLKSRVILGGRKVLTALPHPDVHYMVR